MEGFILSKVINDKEFLKNKIDSYEINRINVEPKISDSGFVFEYRTEDLNMIRRLNLDVLIRGGSGILKGDILKITNHGVFSFHHGDHKKNRGGPPAFWEVFNEEDSTGFIIQKLGDDLDNGDIYYSGSVATSFLHTLNFYRIVKKSNIFLIKLLEKLSKGEDNPRKRDINLYSEVLFTVPSIRQQLVYVAKKIYEVIKRLLFKLSKIEKRWSIGYQYTSDWMNVSLRKSKFIQNPKGRFLADPFVIKKNNEYFCFVEDYSFSSEKGSISLIKIDSSGYQIFENIINEDFHLSYPFIFEQSGQYYMCPESYQANEIRLYKCIEFPCKWEFHKTLMKGVHALDTSIFFENGKWRMLTNIDSSALKKEGSELHLFSADSFDSNNWIPSNQNPIIFDSSRGRNGGLVISKENKYRVSQNSSYDQYGSAFSINLIKEINDNNYVEQHLVTVKPNFKKNLLGTHTFSCAEDIVVFDIVKNEKTNV